jgi:hypothetical protein
MTSPTLRSTFSKTSLRIALSSAGVLASAFFATTAMAGEAKRCPNDMALVGGSCVDKWEGSLVEITPDGTEVPFTPHAAPNGRHVRAVSRPGVTPQAHISMHEAQRACKASGKRLCHGGEWKAACSGSMKTKYPYGNERKPGACVDTGRTSPVQKLKGGVYNHSAMNDPQLNQLPNTLEQTGATATCVNDYGLADMVGNIHEWADDGAFHGGYYLDTKINGEGCGYKTTAHAPAYYDYSTGFRCCADAGSLPTDEEPSQPSEPGAPVAANGDAQPELASSVTAPSPIEDAAFRKRQVSGIFDTDGVSIEAEKPDLTADRNSYYPV